MQQQSSRNTARRDYILFFYSLAKSTPSIGADGDHRMVGDEFAPDGMTPKVFLPCIFSPIF